MSQSKRIRFFVLSVPLATLPFALILDRAQAQTAPPFASVKETSATSRSSSNPSGLDAIDDASDPQPAAPSVDDLGMRGKTDFYLHRLMSFSTLTGPTIEGAAIMAVPPKGYPKEWRQGAGAYVRNFAAVFGRAQTAEFSRYAMGVAVREDPRYYSATSHNAFARIGHAFGFTLVDRSDSGHARPAFANLIGAAAGGFVGDAYLPSNYTDLRHAGVRTGVQLGGFASINLLQEFSPELDKLSRVFTGRLHHN